MKISPKRSFFDPRYRIVTDKYAGYEVQRKLWWWPWWHMPESNTRSTIEAAEKWLAEYLAYRPKVGVVVKEILY